MTAILFSIFFFFFNDTATTEIYTLSLHDALPIGLPAWCRARSDAPPPANANGGAHRRAHFVFWILVTVMPASAFSASNLTLSPTVTSFSIAGSLTRNTIVIPSSMPRFLIGPCFSVILPALSSIFLTSPITVESCARPAVPVSARASSAAAVVEMSLFIVFLPCCWVAGLLDGDAPGHAVVPVIRDQAGIFEGAGLGEFPEDLGCFIRREADAVRIVMLHLGILLHYFGVL